MADTTWVRMKIDSLQYRLNRNTNLIMDLMESAAFVTEMLGVPFDDDLIAREKDRIRKSVQVLKSIYGALKDEDPKDIRVYTTEEDGPLELISFLKDGDALKNLPTVKSIGINIDYVLTDI